MTELTRAFLLSVYTLGVLLFLCSLNAFAEQTKPIHIPAGLYQGIQGETARYTLLEFKDNDQHSLINLHIATSFRKGEIHQFTNEQVNCSPLLCQINVATQQGEQINLHLAPYLETGFNVLEVIAGNNGKVLLSSHYTLVHRQGQSTPRSFMEKYSQQLMAQTPLASNSVYGFWLGTLMHNGQAELVSLSFMPDKTSYFTHFVNSQDIEVKTEFSPDNVRFEQGEILIDTRHFSFANQLIIHQASSTMLTGYAYSVHKGVALQGGQFTLFKINAASDTE